MLVQPFVEFDEAALAVLPNVKAHGNDRLVRPRHRVHVLNAVDLIKQFFQRRGNQLLDFRGRMTRKSHINVGHWNDDLRVFLAGREDQRGRAQRDGDENQYQRKV